MLRTLDNVTDAEIAAAPSISVIVGDGEPIFILPPADGVDELPGLIILANSIQAAEDRVQGVLGEFYE